MNRVLAIGALLTILGVTGYAIGISTAYPARAFSVTLVMVGVALVAMWRAFDGMEGEP